MFLYECLRIETETFLFNIVICNQKKIESVIMVQGITPGLLCCYLGCDWVLDEGMVLITQ